MSRVFVANGVERKGNRTSRQDNNVLFEIIEWLSVIHVCIYIYIYIYIYILVWYVVVCVFDI